MSAPGLTTTAILVREWVVEGVQSDSSLDLAYDGLARSRVVHVEQDPVLDGVPEQRDCKAVAFPGSELPKLWPGGLRWLRRSHADSRATSRIARCRRHRRRLPSMGGISSFWGTKACV